MYCRDDVKSICRDDYFLERALREQFNQPDIHFISFAKNWLRKLNRNLYGLKMSGESRFVKFERRFEKN